MKERPILFSAPMVRAILDDRKTQTRRVKGISLLNECPNEWALCGQFPNGEYEFACRGFSTFVSCPYGQIGDILWVRETFTELDGHIFYRADDEAGHILAKWKPSIFMPKSASRIKLRITNIRLEHLQDITESDAIAEGIEQVGVNMAEQTLWRRYDFRDGAEIANSVGRHNATDSYCTLWDSIR